MSGRLHPRMCGTRPSSTHQKTKKTTLLSTMNAAWATNVQRCASDALRFVVTSAFTKCSSRTSSSIHLECPGRAPEHELSSEAHDSQPGRQPGRQHPEID